MVVAGIVVAGGRIEDIVVAGDGIWWWHVVAYKIWW